MEGLELPGGMRIAQPDPVAVQIVQALAPLLQGLMNQLDLLIRIEAGVISRADAKKMIEDRDKAALAAASNGRVG